ncbi:MAG: hypothetical protein ACOC5T_03465 [Elusimicrobiota bacterium]
MEKCDICGSTKNVIAGRWIFYCPKHKHKDWEKARDNELSSGDGFMGNDEDVDYALDDGELSEMIEKNI